jgi:ornithine cyclodeaminase
MVQAGLHDLDQWPIKPDDAFWLENRVILDNVHLHEAYVEAVASLTNRHPTTGSSAAIYRLIDDGKLPALADFTDIGSIINGKPGKRKNAREKIAFVACGMSVFDLGWGYQLYKNALEKGIGTKLLLWDEPFQE